MPQETGDVLFAKSVFGGFNRKDVINYIDTLQRELSKEKPESALSAQCADLQAHAQALESERDALQKKVHALEEEITHLRALLKVEQTQNELLDEKLRGTPEESFSAVAETVTQDEEKGLSMRDVDEMVQKYFG